MGCCPPTFDLEQGFLGLLNCGLFPSKGGTVLIVKSAGWTCPSGGLTITNKGPCHSLKNQALCFGCGHFSYSPYKKASLMIFSRKHKFVFIKGRKMAGTSIEIALSSYCGAEDVVTPISPVDELHRLALGGRAQNYSGSQDIEAEFLDLVRAEKFEDAKKTGVLSGTDYPFFNHMSLTAVETLLNPPSQSYMLIYAIRNPYSKVASLGNMFVAFQTYSGKPMEHPIEDIRKSIARLFETGNYMNAYNHELYQSQRRYKAVNVLRQEHLSAVYKFR